MSLAMGQMGDGIRCCRRDDDKIGPARKFDMPHGSFGCFIPQILANGFARDSL